MATIRIPPVLRPSVGGEREVDAEGSNVGEVLHALAGAHPEQTAAKRQPATHRAEAHHHPKDHERPVKRDEQADNQLGRVGIHRQDDRGSHQLEHDEDPNQSPESCLSFHGQHFQAASTMAPEAASLRG